MSQMWMLRWVILLAGLQFIQAGFMLDYGDYDFHLNKVELTTPPTTPVPFYQSNQHSSMCSTWESFHFKMFDGDIYQYPGLCEYNLVSDCISKQFSVDVKRAQTSRGPKISSIVVSINGKMFSISENKVMIDDKITKLPVYESGILIEENTIYTNIRSKIGLTVMWSRDGAVTVELDNKYQNKTCGLCGNFNEIGDEFDIAENTRKMGYIEFGNKHKINSMESCENPSEIDEKKYWTANCGRYRAECEEHFRAEAWSSCAVSYYPYVDACVYDRCFSENSSVCATLSEYSRQCSHNGGTPSSWRTKKFCAVECPYNMSHSESGSPCIDTCSHVNTNKQCEEHNIDGCFCPPGTVFDDILNMGCILREQCHCKHDRIYKPKEVLHEVEQDCVCQNGKWSCKIKSVVGRCAVEEGSHFTTFDGQEFTFHGDCKYVLSKDSEGSKFIILGQITPCAALNIDTCLKSIEVIFNNYTVNRLVISEDGTVKHNGQVLLPYTPASYPFIVFNPSSFHILIDVNFGLRVLVQLVPLMQVYITVDQSFKTKTRGLCGNFNKVLVDDMKTPQGLVEGTAVSFANAWKVETNCPDRSDREDNPCSFNSASENFAEHWCYKIMNKSDVFAKCHNKVNPESYYKRCKYASCTCARSEDCLCAVFSSYVRACMIKNVTLKGWRENVCGKYIQNCPASQRYFYYLKSCQPTCLSLSSEHTSCKADFVPVDGCACPDGLYKDQDGQCVPIEKCPCYNDGKIVQPGTSIDINGQHCVCENGVLRCESGKSQILECALPKVYFNCSTARPDQHGLKCEPTCMRTMEDCLSQTCESGCLCPSGLLDDGTGNCVERQNCTCPYNGQLYLPKSEITVSCNNCTCENGTWNCTENKCPETCTIYGSGHYKSFDNQRFAFHGYCSYIAAQDFCGNATGQFQVITENIPCGTTGTTCSKSVLIQLGETSLRLSDGTVSDLYMERDIWINTIGMYLVVNTDIGLTILWDRKTTVSIILQPYYTGKVCGLCGNFNGDGKDDFTTKGGLQTSNIIEFVESWKQKTPCPDSAPDFDPCFKNPYRLAWAQIKCAIINKLDGAFKDCHYKVDPSPYYDNCLKDTCACDTGGDCECLCTAVAAYAQACNKAGVGVVWRTPEICPVYCEYYNMKYEECTWHYVPDHPPCYKTCQNPDGACNNSLPNMEGCFPKCPDDKPFYDEINNVCVENCYPTTTTFSTISVTTTTLTPSTATMHIVVGNTTTTTPVTPVPQILNTTTPLFTSSTVETSFSTSTTSGTTPTSTLTTTSTLSTTSITATPSTTSEISSTTSISSGSTPTSTATANTTTT
ncbi:mucin-2-like, partial [Danio aesculapii]|uniref:mucin-2-like n=1 Tax=Danio aesculapii TaxID=1142201 RepID=UPI0024BF5A21